jgi:hypothetical protein
MVLSVGGAHFGATIFDGGLSIIGFTIRKLDTSCVWLRGTVPESFASNAAEALLVTGWLVSRSRRGSVGTAVC